ncbi:MAG: ATP-grasp domain-containing protein [Clostridiales Family XIII bacterium]|jgi:D-aspartate ligase|nr:ATP-grasp domain-containing protein [Clostridiales Family XIII bacterium]
MCKKLFIPLLFASDINVYSIARAFHEKYNVVSKVYGKAKKGFCTNSKIIDYTATENADNSEILKTLVMDFAKKHPDKKIILLGCGDSYVESIIKNKNFFPENILINYPEESCIKKLVHKEYFYKLCDENKIPYPKTFVHKENLGLDFKIPFSPPYIIKPSNGILYWQFPFNGQKKVFKLETREESINVLKKIYASGYNDSVIIQDFIPGDDTYMRVITNYSDRNSKVKMSSLGHVLLEEHTPTGLGNHAVIITETDEKLSKSIIDLLEKLKYKGFSNFDLKYDKRDNEFKVFELNIRQGRSNYYVTGAGINIAKIIVDDLIENSNSNSNENKVLKTKENFLWVSLPIKVAINNIKEENYKKEIKHLVKMKKWVNPLRYKLDNGFLHKLTVLKNQLSHTKKFKKYYNN